MSENVQQGILRQKNLILWYNFPYVTRIFGLKKSWFLDPLGIDSFAYFEQSKIPLISQKYMEKLLVRVCMRFYIVKCYNLRLFSILEASFHLFWSRLFHAQISNFFARENLTFEKITWKSIRSTFCTLECNNTILNSILCHLVSAF